MYLKKVEILKQSVELGKVSAILGHVHSISYIIFRKLDNPELRQQLIEIRGRALKSIYGNQVACNILALHVSKINGQTYQVNQFDCKMNRKTGLQDSCKYFCLNAPAGSMVS